MAVPFGCWPDCLNIGAPAKLTKTIGTFIFRDHAPCTVVAICGSCLRSCVGVAKTSKVKRITNAHVAAFLVDPHARTASHPDWMTTNLKMPWIVVPAHSQYAPRAKADFRGVEPQK